MTTNSQKSPKVLLLATTSYAGMGPYVASIINYFKDDDDIRYFVIEREDRYYSRNIYAEIKGKIIKEKTPSKLTTIKRLLIPFADSYADEIIDYCVQEKINAVHTLTSLSDFYLTKKLVQKYHLLYTVHDLHPHEAKKTFYKKYRQNVYYKRIFKAIRKVNFLFTNSSYQLEELQMLYPNKESFLAPFPSLITKEVAFGNEKPPELASIKDYILFFGRIEEYKGLNILIDAFLKADLGNKKLVIAGKGEIRIPQNNQRIIFINRYIKDAEIASLYRNASCVVYPYISATQSGVLSVASYFQTPIIASNIPFFIEVLGNDYPGLFENEDRDSLTLCLNTFFSSDLSIIKNRISHLYMTKYSLLSQYTILKNIYENLFQL